MAPRVMLLPITWVPLPSQYPSWVAFLVFPLTTISHVFLRFRAIRFSIDQRWIFCTSSKDKSAKLDLIGASVITVNVMLTVYFTRRFLFGYTAMMSFTMMENKTGPKTGLVSNKMSSFRPPDSAKNVTSETHTGTDNPCRVKPKIVSQGEVRLVDPKHFDNAVTSFYHQ